MELEFVNHASVIYSHGDVRLIADPWIEGTVFQNAWSHLAKTAFTYEDYKDITHIWFSHEHPDHFFPPNIKKIPEAYRQQITVVFKETSDKKVVQFCRKMGFKDVIELPLNTWFDLTDDIRLLCYPCHDDSTLVFEAGEQTVVNTNDCVFPSIENIGVLQSLIGGDVDVLLTQFSYASYVGETYSARREQAKRKYDQISTQIQHLAPKYLIPFASFIYFCHEDNFYMNDAVNRIDEVYDHLCQHSAVTPIVLYPGDNWVVGEEHDSSKSVGRYLDDCENIKEPLVLSKLVDAETIMRSAEEFHKRLTDRVAYLNLLKAVHFVRPLRIYLTDHERAYQLDLGSFVELPGVEKNECGITMSSETLDFCLKFDYGFNTTAVNGKFHILDQRALQSFNTFTTLGDAMNHGRVTWGSLVKRTQRRIGTRLRSMWKAA